MIRTSIFTQLTGAALIATALFFSSCASTPDSAVAPEQTPGVSGLSGEEYRERIATILETFDGIMMTAEGESELVSLYRSVRPLLVDGRVRVQPDFAVDDNSFSRGRFTLDEENSRAVILIDSRLIDESPVNPVPALSSYAGMLAHMQDYQAYGSDITAFYADPLEYYLAQMDAIYLQGIFVRNFALPLYGEEGFSDFEYYVLQSLEIDAFSSHSLFVWSIDKDIVYSMLGLSTQFSRAQVSAADYVEEVLLLGREVRDNLERSRRLFSESGEAGGDDGEVARRSIYIAATSANTYRTLGSIIFSTIIANRFEDGDFEEYEESLREINEIYGLLELLLEGTGEFRSEYRREYLASFVSR